VLIYDWRNPSFQPHGNAWKSFVKVKDALVDQALLQLCSWQRLISYLRRDRELDWLTEQLRHKYGL
jgi:hypothetical protein